MIFICIGGSCHVRVTLDLSQRFKTPKIAEKFFDGEMPSLSSVIIDEQQLMQQDITSGGTDTDTDDQDSHNSSLGGSTDTDTDQDSHNSSLGGSTMLIESINTLEQTVQRELGHVEPMQHLHFISELLASYFVRLNLSVPRDFLELSIKGMIQLEMTKRSNILYGLAKGLGTQCSCGSDSLFPTKQVITGLVEYSINFFNAKTIAEVRLLIICTPVCLHVHYT